MAISKTKALKHVVEGIVPVSVKYSSLKIPTEEEIKRILEGLQKTSQQYLDKFHSWKRERQNCIQEIRELAKNITFHNRNTNIAQILASLAGIGGGALAIAGLALTPVTGGLSLGLTIAGAVVGGGAALTGVANKSTSIGVRIDRTKKAKKCVGAHKNSTDEINNILEELHTNCNEVYKLATEDTVKMFKELKYRDGTECVIHGACSSVTVALTVKDVLTFREALNQLRSNAGITAATTARGTDIVVDTVRSVTKLSAKVVGKAMTGIGIGFGAVGIAFEAVTILYTTVELARGSKTTAATQLLSLAKQMEEELKIAERVYKKLSELL